MFENTFYIINLTKEGNPYEDRQAVDLMIDALVRGTVPFHLGTIFHGHKTETCFFVPADRFDNAQRGARLAAYYLIYKSGVETMTRVDLYGRVWSINLETGIERMIGYWVQVAEEDAGKDYIKDLENKKCFVIREGK